MSSNIIRDTGVELRAMRNGHKQFMEELGETGLIERITRRFKVSSEAVTVGAGEDDCAVIDLESASAGYSYLVVTTDTVQRSTHFPRGISPFQRGWSAVAVNLSDIAAMGAHPFAFVIAMGIPEHTLSLIHISEPTRPY